MLRRVNERLSGGDYGGGGSMSYEDLYGMDSEDERRTSEFLIIIVSVAIFCYLPRFFSLFTFTGFQWRQFRGKLDDTYKSRKKILNSVHAIMASDVVTTLGIIILDLIYDRDLAHVFTPLILFGIRMLIVIWWRYNFA